MGTMVAKFELHAIPTILISLHCRFERKNKGNEYYHGKKYKEAIEAYSQAIDDLENTKSVSAVPPSTTASLLLNRAAALLMLLQYREALIDCERAISLDSTNSKSYFRKATALKGLGRFNEALNSLGIGLELDPKSGTALAEKESVTKAISLLSEAHSLLRDRKFRLALSKTEDLAKVVAAGSNSREVSLIKIEALIELNRVEEAYNLSNSMVRSALVHHSSFLIPPLFDSLDEDGIHWRCRPLAPSRPLLRNPGRLGECSQAPRTSRAQRP